MAYKLTERYNQDNRFSNNGQIQDDPDSGIDLGKIATIFIVFGLLGLLTAWFYSHETDRVLQTAFSPTKQGASAEVGPLNVRKYGEVYSINIKADLPRQSWSHIQGEVLNSNKQYLFAFGEELSRYSGVDSDGSWSEVKNDYDVNVTFPKPGVYYAKLSVEGDRFPSNVQVKISKKRGSALPHFWFGILSLIIGVILNEIRNRTIRNLFEEFES